VWRPAAADPGYLPSLRRSSRRIADMVHKGGLQIQYVSYMIDVMAAFVVAQRAGGNPECRRPDSCAVG